LKGWRMTSKERMLTAFRNQEPDMVPVCPDMSNMIPAKLTGRPFWDVYLFGTPLSGGPTSTPLRDTVLTVGWEPPWVPKFTPPPTLDP